MESIPRLLVTKDDVIKYFDLKDDHFLLEQDIDDITGMVGSYPSKSSEDPVE